MITSIERMRNVLGKILVVAGMMSLALLVDVAAAEAKSKEKDQAAESDQTHLVSPSMYVASGLVTTLTIGGGLGHAMQGRWKEKGWIFTSTMIGLPLAGAIATGHAQGALIGFLLYLPFHVWEIVDIWAAPTVGDADQRADAALWERPRQDLAMSGPREYIVPLLTLPLGGSR